MRILHYAASVLLLGLTVGSALAQTIECPLLENAAFAEAATWCHFASSGQACYGNSPVESDVRDASTPFQQAGHTARLSSMTTLTTHTAPNQYGVTVNQIQVYPTDSWEAEDATLISFGETSLINQGQEYNDLNVLSLAVTEVSSVNVRVQPSTASGEVGGVHKDQVIKATGRLADNSWLRVQMPEGHTGWVSAVVLKADFTGLPVVSSADPVPPLYYRPFTAFTLSNRFDDARCPPAPPSGVLIQTPRAMPAAPNRLYKLLVNGVAIEMEGSVFLQGAPSQELRVSVLEGYASVTALDETQEAVSGQRIVVRLSPLDNSTISPVTVPLAGVPYDYERLLPLPMRMLPRFAYVDFDVRYNLFRARPTTDVSPIGQVLATDPCRVSVTANGVNLRAGAGRDFPIRAVVDYRESTAPIAKALGTDSNIWWQLSQDVWISNETVVTGGDCTAVPEIDLPRLPPAP